MTAVTALAFGQCAVVTGMLVWLVAILIAGEREAGSMARPDAARRYPVVPYCGAGGGGVGRFSMRASGCGGGGIGGRFSTSGAGGGTP